MADQPEDTTTQRVGRKAPKGASAEAPVDAEVLDSEEIAPEELEGHDPDDDAAEAEEDIDSGESPDDSEDGASALVPAPVGTSSPEPGGDTLTRYMAQLRHHAPISREEEQVLARRWVEEGDVDAARHLVMANLRLVVKLAFEYRRAWTNTLDLIQEGNVGLMEAVQRFDPYQGVKLSSYAVYWIRAYILKYILDNMRSVRMGTTRAQRKLFFRLNKEKRELERQGYEVEPRLIAERLDVSEDDVIDMEARLSRPDQSMDAPVRDEDGSATYGDFMSGDAASAEDQVGSSELAEVFREQIEQFRETLDERELRILDERVLSPEPRTLAEMGEEFGVSRERVRQLEARLIKNLRESMKEQLVDFEYYAPGSDD